MDIIRNAATPSSSAPPAYFTGRVRIDAPFRWAEPSRLGGAIVTFEPGGRTAWHTHPLGQTLIVLSGRGWVQREGGPLETVTPGDIVGFAPGERHWHGATDTTAMSHLALSEALHGKTVEWQEKVTEAEVAEAVARSAG
ncbi:MAG: cupin domain-containing protein [Rhodobacteraceae bacterium]|jgi:quercetin dioxygenase-like cupin family protein|nr:cupin domain-containing protein [Paracoccaceae bacterium]